MIWLIGTILKQMAQVAALCMKDEAASRPNMSGSVVEALQPLLNTSPRETPNS